MKDWKDIMYGEAVKSGDLNAVADWVNYGIDNFHIDDKIIDKVPRIPINFNM
mgnify:CR=1 FL=1